MSSGVSLQPGAITSATIRRYRCQHCGAANEIRWPGFIPADFYNVVRDYVRASAGDDFVLLPVDTLNAMGAERERLARELEVAQCRI